MANTASVIIYTTPVCGYCHMAKEYLTGKHIAYEERDITNDEKAQEWVFTHTGQLAVPVLHIGEDVILGFDRPNIDKSLEKNHVTA